jgi:hypothetical protein
MNTRPDLDADLAVRALTARLSDWKVPEAPKKARAFIDDLTSRGWRCRLDQPARRNPQPHEECKVHAGQYAHRCGGCASDHRAAKEAREEQATHQSQLTRDEALTAARAAVREAKDAEAKRRAELQEQAEGDVA